MSVWAVSDVHGHCGDLLGQLQARGLVDARGDWVGGADGGDELWLLGDFFDRGPDGVGVLDLVRRWTSQAPERVHAVLGNHELLALGTRLFPDGPFPEAWRLNGGQSGDQERLSDDHVDYLRSLPVLGRHDGRLLMHSDTTEYLNWGHGVDEINDNVRYLLASGQHDVYWRLWLRMNCRMEYALSRGAETAAEMLETLKGEQLVHGHTLVGALLGVRSTRVTGPHLYAEDQALAIDGGRFAGGPLLVVDLDELAGPAVAAAG